MKLQKWKEFNKINENIDNIIPWYEAFETYVKGQTVMNEINHNIHYSKYANGVLYKNG